MNLSKPGVRAGLAAAAQGNTEFSLDLYRRLRASEGNLFFSPYSISTALAMTWAGARGPTERQMAQALHFLLDQQQLHSAFAALQAGLNEVAAKGQVELKIANSLWPQEGYAFLEAFLVLVAQHYEVQITPVDYRGAAEAAGRTINAWVEEKTGGKIVDLIQPGMLDELTRLVLVNAIYFKGHWASRFDPRLTRPAPFWIAGGERIQAPLMAQTGDFRLGESEDLQILELPYAGNDVSMLVLLPRRIGGLAGLEEALTPGNLAAWTGRLRETLVEVFLPRFEITCPFMLDAELKSMGMVDAFSDEADFSGMAERPLAISAVLHKAFTAVNEEGTEAAAATAVVTLEKGIPERPVVFRANHPFAFLIREKRTGSILFLGRVLNPLHGGPGA